ncbi:MAG: 2-oxo acid dehydrogenase subunit E2 [Armatimonadetes bacterium]|nr:2-oxo acid dehydrogenase subunit E2 [Armatimonadota bacterium]
MPRVSREPEFDLVEIPPARKAIGDRVSLSRREKPTFDMLIEVRADAIVGAREQYKAEAGDRVLPTYNDIIIKAVGDLLPTYRVLNAWIDEAGVKMLKPINVGFAAATPQGVVLPTVFEVDKKTVWDIATETKDMVDLARNGKLRASLQMGAGFTVSNIGPVGVDAFSAIISPPQVAILTVGSMALRPVVERAREWKPGTPPTDYGIVAAPTVNMVLTVDHRAIDGAEAAPFLKDLRDRLENWGC